MKIALAARPSYALPSQTDKGGWAPGIIVADEAKALTEAGHDVRVYGASGSQVTGEFVDLGFEPQAKLTHEDLNQAQVSIRQHFDNSLYAARIAEHLKANPVDILHIQDYRDLPVFMAAQLPMPVVCTIQGDYLYNFSNRVKPAQDALKQMKLISLTDPGKLDSSIPVPFAIVPNTFDAERFRLVEKPKQRYVFAGRLTPGKGADYLPEIAKHLDLPVDVYGTASGADVFQQDLIEQFKHTKNINYRGSLPHSQIHEAHDAVALLMPNRAPEGFPLTLLEAAGRGTPTVSFDIGKMNLMINNGVSGKLVLPGDIQAYIKAVSDAGKLNRKQVRRHVLENFGPEKIAGELIKVFEKAIAG